MKVTQHPDWLLWISAQFNLRHTNNFWFGHNLLYVVSETRETLVPVSKFHADCRIVQPQIYQYGRVSLGIRGGMQAYSHLIDWVFVSPTVLIRSVLRILHLIHLLLLVTLCLDQQTFWTWPFLPQKWHTTSALTEHLAMTCPLFPHWKQVTSFPLMCFIRLVGLVSCPLLISFTCWAANPFLWAISIAFT